MAIIIIIIHTVVKRIYICPHAQEQAAYIVTDILNNARLPSSQSRSSLNPLSGVAQQPVKPSLNPPSDETKAMIHKN